MGFHGSTGYNLVKLYNRMGDHYYANQVGALGPNAHAHDMNFTQLWQKNEDRFDLNDLCVDLEKLRKSMQTEASTAEHYSEIGAIANAEIEARNEDGPRVLEALSKVSNWSLKVAEKIGVNVATGAIKAVIGI